MDRLGDVLPQAAQEIAEAAGLVCGLRCVHCDPCVAGGLVDVWCVRCGHRAAGVSWSHVSG